MTEVPAITCPGTPTSMTLGGLLLRLLPPFPTLEDEGNLGATSPSCLFPLQMRTPGGVLRLLFADMEAQKGDTIYLLFHGSPVSLPPKLGIFPFHGLPPHHLTPPEDSDGCPNKASQDQGLGDYGPVSIHPADKELESNKNPPPYAPI